MNNKNARAEARGLLSRVRFPDKTDKVLEALCRFYVDGEKSDFLFGGSHDNESHYAPILVKQEGGEVRTEAIPGIFFSVDSVIMELLKRAKIMNVQKDEHGEYITPTDRGIKIYETKTGIITIYWRA